MSLEQYGVFAILAGLIALLTLTRLSAAWVFGAVAVLTYLTDLLNVQQFAASFTDSSLLTLVLLLLVSIALEKTRLISWVGQQLNNGGLRTVLGRLWISTAVLSSFTANTAVVASLIGAIKRSQKFAPSKLMLPMAFAATFGGTLTLIGTSTNLVVNSFLDKAELPLLQFFTTTAVGAGVVLSGMLMMWLIADRLPVTEKAVEEADLPYFLEARLTEDSVLIGKTIGEAGLRHLRKLFLAEIVRGEQNIAPVCPDDRLQQGDVLLFAGDMESVALLQEIQGLTLYGHHSMNGQALVEAIISHSSSLNGVSLKDAKFREEFDAVVVAVKRGQERLQGGLGSIVLQTGDTLLLVPGKTFHQNNKLSKEFLLVNGVDSATRLSLRRSWGVLSAFVAVVGLSMTGELPLLKGLVLLLIGLMATGIISMQEVRRRFPLDIVLIVGGALVLSQAMENTGVSALLGQGLLQVFSGYHLFWALAALYFFTLILTELMSNNAAAALACPLAISLAKAFGIDPMPLIMAVLFGASASFISPWGYQTNLLVFTVGNYKLSQYIKVGLPMALAYSIAVLTLIPLFFPFQSL
ncbi:MAG: SLC13 family permease [Gammaproteobacteria bacterium]|nr:SLC13 family permease [Gammaproteobacteria bacterium]MBU2059402.1 SLC13 family permease [Gammaproteobacteria bacterium]MBU2175218.1 SLC13 family permease [Gammaproteobacteria bacterium]MBU2247426.1 SLC13 family permease [Gammaproteobacteria bacterium]MBU2346307.1 SLC13 family permease [Gammaproteobacteria bacterium]